MTSQLITTMTETWTGAARPAHRSGSHDDAPPGPSDYVDQFFDFWVQLLEAQRSFVLSGIHGLLPSEPAPVQAAPTTPSRARSLTDGTSSASGSTTAVRTIDSTADEQISGSAADAIATAAAITAEKTAVEKTPAATTAATSTAGTPRKTSTSAKTSTTEKTSAAKKSSAPKKASTPEKASAPEKSSTAKKTSAAKNKRS